MFGGFAALDFGERSLRAANRVDGLGGGGYADLVLTSRPRFAGALLAHVVVAGLSGVGVWPVIDRAAVGLPLHGDLGEVVLLADGPLLVVVPSLDASVTDLHVVVRVVLGRVRVVAVSVVPGQRGLVVLPRSRWAAVVVSAGRSSAQS